ncbi:MAG: uncharacterized protein JWM78_3276 [Verrucomicrobiaceae bacterium]|nr:uncharacterized protein [Verrucomicrobiaceae bacterium]
MIRSRNKLRRTSQRGAALVVALLIVAMVVMLATALSSDFLLMFRRVENQLYSEQAYAYLQSAEELGRAALLQDLQRDGDKRNDNLAEPWAQEQNFPTDYGWISGQIEDLGGRFNVNGLTSASKTDGTTGGHSALQNQFIRLLLTLKLILTPGVQRYFATTSWRMPLGCGLPESPLNCTCGRVATTGSMAPTLRRRCPARHGPRGPDGSPGF